MKNILFYMLFGFFIVFIAKSVLKGKSPEITICQKDFLHNTSLCKLKCPSGSFALPGMESCHPWLTCDADIFVVSLISVSVVKTVYLAKWGDFTVTLSVLSDPKFLQDFSHNIFMIKSLSPNSHIVQLIGYCKNSILTEYHELGSALNTHYHLKHSLKAYDSLKTRLQLCISYLYIIRFLHNSPVGVRVMCDSNTLQKTLSQYLLTTNLNLIANDLDATPVVNNLNRGIHCGSKELSGSFVAPEQKWPYPEKEFDVKQMPLYDEKTDIYKVPDVCNWLLGDSSDSDVIKYRLFNFHKNCKNTHPFMRPSADEIINVYENVLNDIS